MRYTSSHSSAELCWTDYGAGDRIKPAVTDQGKASPSAARTFSSEEVNDLLELALALPPGWHVAVEPPFGQVRLSPNRGAPYFHDALVVGSDGRLGPTRTHAAR